MSVIIDHPRNNIKLFFAFCVFPNYMQILFKSWAIKAGRVSQNLFDQVFLACAESRASPKILKMQKLC